MITVCRRLLFAFFALFLMTGVARTDSTHSSREENCLLQYCVLSDVHMESNNKTARDALIRVLSDVANHENGNDALVLLGDNTMNGQHIEYLCLGALLQTLQPADTVLMALGNHDVGNYTAANAVDAEELAAWQADYEKRYDRFVSFNNTFSGLQTDKAWYSTEVEGYRFIFLSTEAMTCNDYTISDEQLAWLDAELATATANGRPAFVFSHHPYYYTEGAQAEQLDEILTAYPNVFALSGHTHRSMSRYVFGNAEGAYTTTLVNFPRITEGDGSSETGFGTDIEVYEDHVLIRFRNYYTSEWTEFEQRVELVK